MKKQEQIFYLIHSLSQKEKKQFREEYPANQNFRKLFDVIDSQSTYNSKEIKELFKNSKFIKQLHVTKNILIKKILKNLRNHDSVKSVNLQLNNYLSEIEILYKRELFDQCLFLTEKAEALAKHHEKFSYLNIILDWKQKLFLQKYSVTNDKKLFTDLFSEKDEYSENLKRENTYWNITIDQYDNFGKPNDEKMKFMQNEFLINEGNTKSLRAKINFHHINYSHFVTSGKPIEALNHLEKTEQEIEAVPHRITEDPAPYITTLNNKVSLLLNIKKHHLIPELLNKIREIPDKYNIIDKEKISTKLNVRTFNVELEMYRDIKDYESALKIIPTIENYINENNKAVSKDYVILFYYQFAYIYFMFGDFDKSLNWTNKLFQNDFAKIRNDIYTYTRFLNLMIHFELGNKIVLKYAVDATRKHLRKKRSLLSFEKVLLKFFSKISLANKDEHKLLFERLKIDLFEKTEVNLRIDILDYIDFEDWINNKLTYL